MGQISRTPNFRSVKLSAILETQSVSFLIEKVPQGYLSPELQGQSIISPLLDQSVFENQSEVIHTVGILSAVGSWGAGSTSNIANRERGAPLLNRTRSRGSKTFTAMLSTQTVLQTHQSAAGRSVSQKMLWERVCHTLHHTDASARLVTVTTALPETDELRNCNTHTHTHTHTPTVTLRVCLTEPGRGSGKVVSRLIFRTSSAADLCCRWKSTARHQQKHQSHQRRSCSKTSWSLRTEEEEDQSKVSLQSTWSSAGSSSEQKLPTTSEEAEWRSFKHSPWIFPPETNGRASRGRSASYSETSDPETATEC